ncbi:MAG: hypothetical protein QOH77_482, partial [Actinomycetota bacterium]|nr:hypothetical protein [Actinomycetota bacterium]
MGSVNSSARPEASGPAMMSRDRASAML